MNPHYPLLFSPLKIGHLELKNRIVMGSMHTGLEDSFEQMEKLGAFYEERAKGGVGLIVTGGFAPNRTGWLVPFSGKLSTSSEVKHHRKLTDRVHKYDTKILLQILHAGRYAFHPLAAAPTALKSAISPFKPWGLSQGRIKSTIQDFSHCAELAKEAGYDGVEIMGSEGYLINQFLAPFTNRRTDDWGGTFENRIRFAVEIVKQTRTRVGPDFVLMFRLSILDLINKGSTPEEMLALAKILEKSGVNVFNTGIGWHESRIPTIATPVPRAAFVWATKKLKETVSLPVVAVNRINTPEVAEKILQDKSADLVSMARPLLADAELPKKAREGKSDLINTCIACNQGCLDLIFQKQRATCLVNPRACYETEFPVIPTTAKKKIAVIGAGPAGLAFAVTAAERGHDVTLYEASTEIGGQFNLAKRIPGKEEFHETLRYYRKQIELYKVTLKLNTRMSVDEIANLQVDEVVMSTGTRPRKLILPGFEDPRVLSYTDVITGKAKPGPRVAIIGAGGIGFDTAEFLAHAHSKTSTDVQAFLHRWGVDQTFQVSGSLGTKNNPIAERKIYLLQRKVGKLGAGLGKTTGWIHRSNLQDSGVEMINQVEYRKLDQQGLHISRKGEERILEIDHLIICAGQESENQIAQAIQPKRSIHIIGGAHIAMELDARRAILEGTTLALKI